MTTLARLKSSAAAVGRFAAGTALGLGLFVALAGVPAKALAQVAVAEAPAASATVLPATGAGPALWVVKDADSTLYLFGTVHVLKPDTAWGSAKVDAAFNAASDIYFEISNPDDQAAMLPLIQQYGVSPQTPLSSLLTPSEIADLDAAAKTIGASAAQLDPMRPWLAGLSLSMAPLVKAGYDPQSGVELIFKARAQAAGKPVHGFETLDEQVRILATLPEEAQLEFLRSTLHSFDEAAAELDTLVGAWARGDTATLQKVAVEEMKTEAPAIYEALLTRRNAGFADDIQKVLAGSGTAFIAVGAAHLVGPDSVQAMLAARGVTVEQQ
jgi:uncharacterized protein YbaP (TraB family)